MSPAIESTGADRDPRDRERPRYARRRERRRPSNTSVAVQFVLTGIIWGSSFLFMKVALEGLSPGQVAWSRLVLGGLTLGLFVALRRDRLPRSLKIWGHMTVLAVSFCVVPFLLFSWAQQHVTSGLASIYNATTPIMTAVMAGLLFRVERLKALQIAGILVGILGVVVIIAPWQGLDLSQSLVAQFAILGATACYGFSLAYMRKFVSNTGMTALVFSFLNIGIAAVIMLALTPVVALSPVTLDPWIIGSVLLLGCLGTGVAYIWNQTTVRAWGPTRASTVTYITPIVGVLLGVVDPRRADQLERAGRSASSSSSASCSRRTGCGCRAAPQDSEGAEPHRPPLRSRLTSPAAARPAVRG